MKHELLERLVHISDTHISRFGMFLPDRLDACIRIVNSLDPAPQFVIHTGDLTDYGILMDYEMAVEKMDEFEPDIIYVPGNHDEKNYGDSLFREMVSQVDVLNSFGKIVVLTLGSAIPDSDNGRLGRGRQQMIKQRMRGFGDDILKIVAFHHHLIPVPFAGREKDILEDAGDVLRIILESGVNMVLMGHRHVRNAIKVGETLLVNAGTVSCVRTRGRLGNSFNIIDLYSDGSVEVSEVGIPAGEARSIGRFTVMRGRL
mgnify:CR=1 FL=1